LCAFAARCAVARLRNALSPTDYSGAAGRMDYRARRWGVTLG
jgi:hypothetical protein